MVRISILPAGLVFAVIPFLGKAPEAQAAEGSSVQQSVIDEQAALRHRHYSQATRILEDALKRFPGNVQLRLELGRVYVYQRQDRRAMDIFRAILRADRANRETKPELAAVLGYGRKYQAANHIFAELQSTTPAGEAA